MPSKVSIAIVGLACRYPGSDSPRALWENVLARRQQFRRFVDGRLPVADYVDPDSSVADKVYARRAAYIDGFEFDWRAERIPRGTFESTDVAQWLALDVASSALRDAGVELSDAMRERTGVIVGNTLTGEQSRSMVLRLRWPFVERALRRSLSLHGLDADLLESVAANMGELYRSAFPTVNEDTLQGGLSNTIAGRICNHLDLHGGGHVVDGACSSSLLAVATGADRLAQGDLDLAIVGGVDISLDPMELVGFAKTNALTPGDMRVYDADANGFIPGEGAGFAVLRRLDDALADGDRIYAVLRGWGISSDGKGAMTAPSGAGQARAITRAWQHAGIEPGELSFVEGHGTGTAAGDLAELRGLQLAVEQLGGATDARCGMTSVKSLVGHTKAAAGMAGFLKAVIAVNQRVIPPTAGIRRPNPVFERECRSLYPVLHGERLAADQVLVAGVSAMGFGGINTHVVVASADPPHPALRPSVPEEVLLLADQRSELYCLGAPSIDGLADAVRALVAAAGPLAVAEMPALARATNLSWRSDAPVRAAFVVRDPERLEVAANQLLAALAEGSPGEERAAPDGSWWLGVGEKRPVIGFLFPGQGAQFAGTARVPIGRFTWARAMQASLVDIARANGLGDAGPWTQPPPSEPVHAAALRDRLRDTRIAQPLICLSSAIYTELLRRLGVRPRVVGGHSLGELGALHAAGAFDLDGLLSLAVARGLAIAESAPDDGAMANLDCDADRAAELLAGLPDAVVANCNSPVHTVIGGSHGSVGKVVERAGARGVSGRMLDVSHAFHTAHMDRAVAALADGPFADRVVPELSATVLSSVDGRPVAPGSSLLAHFQRQVRAPVDFVALTHRMAAVCDVVIEVGPGRALSALTERTVGRALCMPVEPADDGFDALNRVLARLAVRGVPLELGPLYEARGIEAPVPFAERRFIDNPCERPMTSGPVAFVPRTVPAAPIAAHGMVSLAALKSYLAGRGDFLVDVVAADLRSSSARPPAVAAPPAVELVEPEAAPTDPVPTPEATPAAASDLHAQLVQILVEKTGFDPSGITADTRLLEDLNLDSIKAGEVLFRLVNAAGLAGQLTLTDLTNAPLAEIVRRLEEARTAAPTAPRDRATELADRWIRRFVVSLQATERESLLPEAPREGRVLVLHDLPDSPELDRLREEAGPSDWQRWDRSTEAAPSHEHVVLLLPAMVDPLAAAGGIVVPVRSALSRARETLLMVCRGGPYGLVPSAGEEPGVGLSGFAASLQEERRDLSIGVLQLTREPLDRTWIGPTLDACRRMRGFATVAVDPADPDVLWVPRLRPIEAAGSEPIPSDPDDVWVVTGGARGITLACALRLAETRGGRFALLGRSPWPEDEGHPLRLAVQRYQDLGVTVRYFSCDVADPAQVVATLAEIETTLGPVRHLVHGAGANRPRRFLDATAEQALDELAAKVGGLENLLTALDPDALRSVVAISSIIGVTGMPGNTWYAFANEALDRRVALLGRRSPAIHARTVAFTLWGETGMVDELQSLQSLKDLGVVALGTAEGVTHFLSAYDVGSPGRTVVTGSMARFAAWPFLTGGRPEPAAFLGEIVSVTTGVEAVVRVVLSVDADPYLADHDFRGTLLFPTVMGLEAMAEAARLATGPGAAVSGFANVSLAQPITVTKADPAHLVLHAEVAPGGRRVEVAIYADATGYAQPHFRAEVLLEAGDLGHAPAVPDLPDLAVVPRRDLYGDLLFQGPRFQRMGRILELDQDHILFEATLDGAAEVRSGPGPILTGDPYLRDVLLQGPAVPLAPDQLLPISIGSVVRSGTLPVPAFVRATITKREGDEVEAEVVLQAGDGTVHERLTAYRARVVQRRPDRPAVADYLAPDAFNQRTLAAAVAEASARLDLPLPHLHLLTGPALSSGERAERHAAQAVALRALLPGSGLDPRLELGWRDDGRPMLTLDGQEQGARVSLSHDDQGLVIAALGDRPVACDIERLANRPFAEWQFLLGPHNAVLFNRIFSVGDSRAVSGHRVWAAMEVAYKLGVAGPRQEVPLELQGYRDRYFAFYVRGAALTIVTFPFRPVGAEPVMVGVGVARPPVTETARSHPLPTVGDTTHA